MHEMPSIAASTYASNTLGPNQMMGLGAQQFGGLNNAAASLAQNYAPVNPPTKILAHVKKEIAMSARRLVQVFIADPNENVPLTSSVLYSGEQKLTDSTDQELFFELDIKKLLDDHNEKRIKVIDKKIKERTEYLEPAKIRDLKMVVVTVATF